MSELQIEFGIPEHGWVDVRFGLDGTEYADSVSDVPQCSLRLLAEVARLATDPQPVAEKAVPFFLEPQVLWLRVVLDGSPHCRVVLQIGEGRTHRVIAETEVERRTFALSVANALQRAEAGFRDEPSVWSWPFPADLVGELCVRANAMPQD